MIDVNSARSLKVGTCLKIMVSPWGFETPPHVIEGVIVCTIGADEGLDKKIAHYYVGEHGDADDPTLAKFDCMPYTRLVILELHSGKHYLIHCTEEWFETVNLKMQLMSVKNEELNVYTCNDFIGHNPVGQAAVIIAPDEKDAEGLFSMALDAAGLSRANLEHTYTLNKIDLTKADAIILADGNY